MGTRRKGGRRTGDRRAGSRQLTGMAGQRARRVFPADKRGSQMVEATMVMPLTVLIMVALIGLMMTFFGEFSDQIKVHETERKASYEKQETDTIRLRDKLQDLASDAGRAGEQAVKQTGKEA